MPGRVKRFRNRLQPKYLCGARPPAKPEPGESWDASNPPGPSLRLVRLAGVPGLASLAVKPLREPAFAQKRLLQLLQLASEQKTRLIDQANQSVRRYFRRGRLESVGVRRLRPVRLVRQIPPPHRQGLRRVLVPQAEPALAQKVLVVQQQFFQARPRHAGQLQFGFLGSGGRHAALGDILHPAARRLHHLVVGARLFLHEPPAENHRAVIRKLRRLETPQLAVAAMRRNQTPGVVRPGWPVRPVRIICVHFRLPSFSSLPEKAPRSKASIRRVRPVQPVRSVRPVRPVRPVRFVRVHLCSPNKAAGRCRTAPIPPPPKFASSPAPNLPQTARRGRFRDPILMTKRTILPTVGTQNAALPHAMDTPRTVGRRVFKLLPRRRSAESRLRASSRTW